MCSCGRIQCRTSSSFFFMLWTRVNRNRAPVIWRDLVFHLHAHFAGNLAIQRFRRDVDVGEVVVELVLQNRVFPALRRIQANRVNSLNRSLYDERLQKLDRVHGLSRVQNCLEIFQRRNCECENQLRKHHIRANGV